MRDDCCVFILSYDRPQNVKTVDTLEKHGYTGDWYIVIDHEDDRAPYEREHGAENVIFLEKDDALPDLDRGDNFNRRDCNVYARQQLWDVAEERGYDYFMVLDDDYYHFQYRFTESFEYHSSYEYLNDLDSYLDAAIEYLERADLDALCMAQGGDFIGGKQASFAQGVQTKRKAMNTFLCATDRPFDFRGTINEDVNTYVRAAQHGKVFLTVNFVSVDQEDTQQEDGGLTDIYLDQGTYVKSFYTILYAPSCASLTKLHDRADERIHHRVSWRNAVPKIVPESARNK
jgi:hypothetical protein